MNALFRIANILDNGIYEGLALAPVAVSMVLTFRILRFPDVTMDGSFVTGAAVAAVGIIRWSMDPFTACFVALCCGAIAGCFTAFLHVILKIDKLLSGVLTAFVLYSLNLLFLKSSLHFGPHLTALTPFHGWDRAIRADLPAELNLHIAKLSFFLVVALLCKLAVDAFLATETGLALRAAGSNERVLKETGVNPAIYKFVGLAFGNALVALCGALVAQKEGVANSQRGIGMIIFALASYVIGEQLLRAVRKTCEWGASRSGGRVCVFLARRANAAGLTTAALAGSVFYWLVVQTGYAFQIRPELPKLLLAVYIILAIGDKARIAHALGLGRSLKHRAEA